MLHANQRVDAFNKWANAHENETANRYDAYVEGSRETLRLVVEYLEVNSARAGKLNGSDYSSGESAGLQAAANYLKSGLTNDTNETKVKGQHE